MPLKCSEAFIIDVRKLKEADRLVILFTEEEGKIRAVAPSAARSIKRFGGRLERMSQVRASWYESEARDLARLEGCDLIEESFTLHADLKSAALISYIAELTDTFTHEREVDVRYFRLVRSVMAALRQSVDSGLLARYFEVWTLRLHGLMPDLDFCGACNKRLMAGGARVSAEAASQAQCPSCQGGATRFTLADSGARGRGMVAALSPAAMGMLERFRRKPPADLADQAAAHASLAEIEAFAVMMLTGFTGHPFRSYRFLREVSA